MDNYKKSVILLGKTSIGKTSLLASVYHNLKENKELGFELTNGEELDDIYKEMEKYVKSLAEGEEKGNSPTTILKAFRYTINVEKVKNGLDIIFYDIPGEWLRNNRKNDRNKNIEKIQKYFKESSVVIIIVSAPSLMEKEGLYHELFNQPGIINDFIKILQNAEEIEESKEFIFVPIKCEKYKNDLSKLKKEFEKKYSDIIKDIVKKGHICSYIPVETLGCVKFDHFSSFIPGNFESLKEEYSLIDIENTDKNKPTIKSKNSDVLGSYILTKFIEPYKSYESIIESILGKRLSILKKLSKKVKILRKPDRIIPFKFSIAHEVAEKVNNASKCLHSSSRILMFDGKEKNICDIKPGDKVMSLSKNGNIEPQLVRKVIVKSKVNFVKLCFENKKDILTTANHLFYTTQGWKSADNIKINSEVIYYDNEEGLSHKKLIKRIDDYKSDICYNIYVSKNSNFFANGVLVSSISVLRPLRVLFERLRYYLFRGDL